MNFRKGQRRAAPRRAGGEADQRMRGHAHALLDQALGELGIGRANASKERLFTDAVTVVDDAGRRSAIEALPQGLRYLCGNLVGAGAAGAERERCLVNGHFR